MVRHKQPSSLYSLTHGWVVSYIGDRLVNTGYDSPAQQTLATVRSVEYQLYLERWSNDILNLPGHTWLEKYLHKNFLSPLLPLTYFGKITLGYQQR